MAFYAWIDSRNIQIKKLAWYWINGKNYVWIPIAVKEISAVKFSWRR